VAGNVWLAAAVTWSPGHVYADGVRLLQSTSAPADLATNEWTWVAGAGLYVNAGGDNPASHLAAVGHRTHGFLVSGHSHVFIAGFTIQRAEEKGVELVSDSNVVVKRNVIRQCGSGGIAVRGGQDVQVYGNTVSDSNHHGIELREGVTNSLVDNNESFGNLHVGVSWATGIYLADSPNNRIANNRLHDNQDSGCEIQTGSNDNLVCQNLSWNNGDHGFAQLYATGTLLMNNDAWGNHTEGFAVEGSSTGTRLYNCISVNRALDPGSYCVLVDTSSTVGFEADYNIYWGDQPPIKFNNKVYASVAAFQAATGIGPHTFGADPRFVDAAHGDFNLLSDSPAIDDANTTIPGWEPLDANGFIRIDVPGMPNTGTGPVGFADRGALEFRNSVLAVGDGTGAAALALSPAFPNPSRRAVAFTLRLASAADVDFAVYDVLGREVWSERGVRPAGASTLRWTLTGADGARVPDGLYLARVRHGSETETARFVITR
jgi:parallel beta-helix repeat protein